MKKKTLISLIFLVIIIMFSFPWITVSCAGQPIMDATGFQIAGGNYGALNPQNLSDLGMSASDLPNPGPNVWLILVLILLGLGVVIIFTKRERIAYKVSAWISSIVSVMLILFWIILPHVFYNGLAGESSTTSADIAEARQLVQFHFDPAFYFALIFVIGCAFLSFYATGELKERKLPINVSNRSSGPASDESDFIFCPNCGARNPISNKYCSKCGAKLPKRRE